MDRDEMVVIRGANVILFHINFGLHFANLCKLSAPSVTTIYTTTSTNSAPTPQDEAAPPANPEEVSANIPLPLPADSAVGGCSLSAQRRPTQSAEGRHEKTAGRTGTNR